MKAILALGAASVALMAAGLSPSVLGLAPTTPPRPRLMAQRPARLAPAATFANVAADSGRETLLGRPGSPAVLTLTAAAVLYRVRLGFSPDAAAAMFPPLQLPASPAAEALVPSPHDPLERLRANIGRRPR